jgi:hypothetical protein
MPINRRERKDKPTRTPLKETRRPEDGFGGDWTAFPSPSIAWIISRELAVDWPWFLNESRWFGWSSGDNGRLRMMVEGYRRWSGGLGGTGGRWRRRRIGSVMVVLASCQHVIGMARQNSAKRLQLSILSAPQVSPSKSSTACILHPTPFTHFLFYSLFNFYSMYWNKSAQQPLEIF